MGRPLNKKYFGNTNSVPPAGAQIGGEGIASINFSAYGKYVNRLPSVTLPAPSLPGGQQAVGVLHSSASSTAVTTKGTGYQIDDILTDQNGSQWRVTKLRVLSAAMNTAGSNTAWDGTEWIVWDDSVNSHWTSPVILKGVTASGGHVLTGYNAGASVYGVWDGTDGTHAPTTALTITGNPANTPNPTNPTWNTRGAGDKNGSGAGDNNAAGGSITFTYGVEAVEIVDGGDYTSLAHTGALTTTVSPAGGTGATLTANYSASYVAITTAGDGYIGTETVTFTAAGGGEIIAAGTIVLTNLYQNAIVGVDLDTGGLVDIVRQESTNSYWVQGTDPLPYLLELASPTESVGLYLKATDSSSKDYWVKKLTAHKVVLGEVTGGGEFPEDGVTGWTFDTAIAGVSVKIRNAA